MANSTVITDYIAHGTAASRPATPPVGSGVLALWYSTDTNELDGWTGAAWSVLTIGASSWTTTAVSALGATLAVHSGTLDAAPLGAHLIWGNPTASTAIPTGITIGSGLSLSVAGTLTNSAPDTNIWNAGTVTTIGAALNLAAGALNLGTIATLTILANSTGAGAVPIGVPVGTGLLFSGGTLVTTGSAAPTGTAGGDLSGTYPNPAVAKINGVALASTTATSGNLLIANGSSWASTALSGDATVNSGGTFTLGSIVAAATVGSATLIPVVTYDTKGRITATTTAAVPVTAAGNGVALNSGTVSVMGNATTLTGTAAGTVTIAPAASIQVVQLNMPASGTVTVAAAPTFQYQEVFLSIKQGATVGVCNLNTGFVFGTSGGPTSFTITPTAAAIDRLKLWSPDGTKWAVMALNQGFTL